MLCYLVLARVSSERFLERFTLRQELSLSSCPRNSPLGAKHVLLPNLLVLACQSSIFFMFHVSPLFTCLYVGYIPYIYAVQYKKLRYIHLFVNLSQMSYNLAKIRNLMETHKYLLFQTILEVRMT